MKGLGLVLALIKKMKTGDDDISITETETAPLRVKIVLLSGELFCTGAHQASLPMSIFRHAVTSCESGGDDGSKLAEIGTLAP